jgi:hypothetical protein
MSSFITEIDDQQQQLNKDDDELLPLRYNVIQLPQSYGISILPFEIFLYIKTYLKFSEWNGLLNANNLIRKLYSKDFRIFRLNRLYSKQYILSNTFRERILGLIQNPLKQLHLHIHSYTLNQSDSDKETKKDLATFRTMAPKFGTNSDLSIVGIENLLSQVHTVHLNQVISDVLLAARLPFTQCKVFISNSTNFVSCSGLEKLYKVSICNNSQLTDISALVNVPYIKLSTCSVLQDLSPLGKQKFCHLENFSDLSNIGFLMNIQHLVIISCGKSIGLVNLDRKQPLMPAAWTKTSRVSVENEDKRVTMRKFVCKMCKINDLTTLDNIPTVILDSIIDFERSTIQKFAQLAQGPSDSSLNPSSEFKDFRIKTSPIQRHLALTDILTDLNDISYLSCIPHLTITTSGTHSINPSGLGHHITCKLKGKITSNYLTTNCNIYSLDLSSSSGISDASPFQFVKRLNLSQTQVQDVSKLGSLEYLNLSYCSQVKDVSALGSIPTLILSECPGVTDVSQLGRGNRELDLSHCEGLIDVSSLWNVRKLNLSFCFKLPSISCLIEEKTTIYELDVRYCIKLKKQELEEINRKQVIRSFRY